MSKNIKTILNSEQNISSNAEDFYKNYWSDSNEVRSFTTQRNRSIIQKFFPQGIINKNILEIGVGGEGGVILQLKEKNNVLGVDVSDSAIRNAQKFDLNVIKRNLDIEKLPSEDGSVDVVFAFEVFEHFSNPQHALEEIKRVLVDNGKLLISIPNRHTYHWPRLFYPELFTRENFQDFLLSNDYYGDVHNDYFVQNILNNTNLQDEQKSWSIYYFVEKLCQSDSEKYFETGLHFWNKKDEFNLRTRPIEAIELFRKSYYLDKSNYRAKLYLTHALLYRALYNDSEEFIQLYKELIDDFDKNNEQIKAEYIFRIIIISLEAMKYGRNLVKQEEINNMFEWLSKEEDSKKYLEKIRDELEHNSFINK